MNYLSLVVPKISNDKREYQFSTAMVLDHIKKKLDFLLTGDHLTNKKKLETIRYEARRLKYTLDRSTIILITFTEDLMYGDFVQLLDICTTDSLKRYATWDDYFVIFEEALPPKITHNEEIPLIYCGTVFNPKPPPKISLLKKFKEVVKPFTLLQIGSLAVLWLLMFFCPYIIINKQNTS